MALTPTEESYKRDLRFDNDLGVTQRGDLEQVDGLENLRQAIYNRILTTRGGIAHRPSYGVGLGQYQGDLGKLSTQQRLMLDLQEQFEDDPRIASLDGLSVNQDMNHPDRVTIKLTVTPRGQNPVGFTFEGISV